MAIYARSDGRGGFRYWDDNTHSYTSEDAFIAQGAQIKQQESRGLFDVVGDAISGVGESVRQGIQQTIQKSRENGGNQHLNALWNANVTLETDADKAARISEASKILGLDDEQRAGVMRAGLSDEKIAGMALREARRKRLEPEDWEQFQLENPATAKYLSKQENMSVSWDDVKQLKGVEYNLGQVKKHLELLEIEEQLSNITNKIRESDAGLAGLSADQRVEIDNLMNRRNELAEGLDFYSVGGILGGLATYPHDILSGTTLAAVLEGALIGGAVGSTGMGVGAIPGAVAGAGTGLKFGIAGTAGERADNLMYLSNLLKQDRNGQQMDESSAWWGGKFSGFGTALMNLIGLDRLGARFPATDKLVNRFLKTTSPSVLGDPVMREAAWKSYLKTTWGIGKSTVEQDVIFGGGGAAIQYSAEKFAEGLSGLDYGAENEFSFAGLSSSFAGGMYNFLPMAATMGTVSTVGGRYLNNKVSPPKTPLASGIAKSMDALADSKTAKRSPEATKAFLDENLKGMTMEDMKISSKGFMQFWRDNDPENPNRAYEEAQKFGITPEKLDEMVALDDDLTIKTRDFMLEYNNMKTNLRNGFLQEVRDPSLNGATPKELAEVQEQVLNTMKDVQAEAEKVANDEAFDTTSETYQEALRIAQEFAPMAKGTNPEHAARFVTAMLETAEKRGLLQAVGIDSAADALRMIKSQYTNESPSTSDGLSMSISPKAQLKADTAAWAKNIDDYMAGTLKGRAPVRIMDTPLAFTLAGVKRLPIVIDKSIMSKVLKGKHADEFTPDMLKRLPEKLVDPLMILRAIDDKGVEDPQKRIVVVDLKNQYGATVMVPFVMEATKTSNKIASIYGRGKPRPYDQWYIDRMNDANLLYINKKRTDHWLTTLAGAHYGSRAVSSFNLSSSIPTERTLVNLKIQNPAYYQEQGRALAKWIPSAEFGEENRLIPVEMGKAVIQGYKNSNYASLAHEMTHHWTWLMENAVARGNAPEGITKDLQVLREFVGAEEGKTLTEAQYEKIADAFESYMLEGKAPSLRLMDVFDKIKLWMKQLYRKFKMEGVEINDDVRNVFDRMLAADDELARAENFYQYKGLFTNKEASGKAGLKQFASIMDKAHKEAARQMDKRVLEEIKPQMKEVLEEQAVKLRKDIREQMMSEPVYVARALFDNKDNMLKGGSPAFLWIVENGGPLRLDRQSVYEKYGKGALPEKWLTDKGGVTLDDVADFVYEGKGGGDKLFQELTNKPSFSEELNTRVQAGLVQFKENELGTLRDEAIKAVHNQYSLEAVAVELELIRARMEGEYEREQQRTADMIADGREKAKWENKIEAEKQKGKDAVAAQKEKDAAKLDSEVNKAAERAAREQRRMDAKIMKGDLTARVVRESARDYLANTKVGDVLKWQKYAANAQRLSKESARLLAKGDYEGALQAKHSELLNHAIAKEAAQADTEMKKAMKVIERVNKRGNNMKGIPHEFNVQADNLLAKYGLLNREPLKPLDGGEAPSLEEFAKQVNEDYFLLNIPEDILNGEGKNYKDLTLTEFRQLVDAVKSIRNTGRNQDKVMSANTKQTIIDRKNECIEQLSTLPQWLAAESEAGKRQVGVIQWLLEAPSKYIAPEKAKIEYFMRILDKGQEQGPMTRNIWNPIMEGWTKWQDMQKRMSDGYKNLLVVVEWADKDWKQAQQDKYSFDFLPNQLSRYEIICMGFNYGNEGNRDRLRYYFMTDKQRALAKIGKLTDADLAEIDGKMMQVLGKLTAKDWKLIQGVWDMLETYVPDIREHEVACSGVDPRMIEAMPSTLMSADGEMVNLRGGYYPIRYDGEKSIRVADLDEAHALFKSGSVFAATTDHSYTKSRALRVNRPLLLETTTLFDHLLEVGYDISMRKPIMDVHRVLKDERIQTLIANSYGQGMTRAVNNWLKELASSQRVAMSRDEKLLKALRTRASVAFVGFRVQAIPLDMVQNVLTAAWKHGAKVTLDSIAHSLLSFDYIDQYKFAVSKSPFLRDKYSHLDQNLADLRRSIFEESKFRKYLDMAFFAPDMAADFLVQVPIWRHFYDKALMEGKTEHEAITIAESKIKEIGTDTTKPGLSAIQRGTEAQKLYRMFYSYFNGFFCRVWEDFELGRLKWADGQQMDSARLWTRMALLGVTLPAVYEGFMRGYVLNNDQETDPEKWEKNARNKAIAGALGYPLGMSPVKGRIATAGINTMLGVRGDFELSPIESVIEKVFRPLGVIGKYIEKEHLDEKDERKLSRSVMEAAAVGGSYPNKLNDILFNIIDAMDKHDFTFNDLITRRQNQK